MEIIRNDAEIGLPPYSEYKDSNVEWFGNIPMHWKMPRLGSVLQERAEVNVDGKVEQVLSVLRNIGVIPYEEKGEIGNKRSEDITRYKIVRPDDLVVNSMNVIIGSVGLSRYTGCLSPVYYVLKTRREEDVSSDYYGRVFQLKLFQESLVRLGNGILAHRMRIPMEKLKAEHVPQPPLDEQQAIVRYLDHIDRRVRRYIRAKQRLLALLREQKQAIIHQAVTRGLDASAPLKPSGVAWLGEVPAHWVLSRLKFEASNIVDCLHATPVYVDDGEYPAIRTADVEPGKLRLSSARRVLRQQYELWISRLAPRAGDILYSREGERYGLAALVPEGVDLCISQRMMVFRIKAAQSSSYLMWQLNCPHVLAQASADLMGATAPHVNVETIKNYIVVLPPRDEQERIASWITSECAEIDKAIDLARQQIALIQEYRTRLIADVVTGKVDVRAAAAVALPAEVGEEAAWAAGEGEEESEEESEEDGVLVEEE